MEIRHPLKPSVVLARGPSGGPSPGRKRLWSMNAQSLDGQGTCPTGLTQRDQTVLHCRP